MESLNISKVADIVGDSLANKYLDAGWVVLAVAPGKSPEDGEAYVLYSLGWPSKKEKAVYPSEFDEL